MEGQECNINKRVGRPPQIKSDFPKEVISIIAHSKQLKLFVRERIKATKLSPYSFLLNIMNKNETATASMMRWLSPNLTASAHMYVPRWFEVFDVLGITIKYRKENEKYILDIHGSDIKEMKDVTWKLWQQNKSLQSTATSV